MTIPSNWSEHYGERVAPNIGIISFEEQEQLRRSKVAIAGCGAIGGQVAEMLAYFGVGQLHLADPDKVETRNANRQLCAAFSTIGRMKTQVTADRLRDISPDISLQLFEEGVNEANVDGFLKGSDVVVDAIDYFALWPEVILHRSARKKGLNILLGNCIGFGANMFVFTPDSITLENFVGLSDKAEEAEVNGYVIPLDRFCPEVPNYIAPSVLQDIAAGKVNIPTLICGQTFAGSLIATEVVLSILDRPRSRVVAPEYVSIDFLERRFHSGEVS